MYEYVLSMITIKRSYYQGDSGGGGGGGGGEGKGGKRDMQGRGTKCYMSLIRNRVIHEQCKSEIAESN